MEEPGEGVPAQETEVLCMTDPDRSEAELAFQVYKMLDGNEAFSNVSEYHMVPVQAADGSIIGVQVTGVQRGEEGNPSLLPTQLIEFHNVGEAEQPQAEQPLPEESVTPADPPADDPEQTEAVQELDGHESSQISDAAVELAETSEQNEPTPQPSADLEKQEMKTLYRCGQCQFGSLMMSVMRRHLRRHSSKHKCHVCEKTFCSARELKLHVSTHTGEKPYTCHVCGAQFTQNASLKMHILRKHTENVQKEQCIICNAVLFGKNDVKVHIRKQHTYLEVPIKCRICSEEFHERYLYRQHQESHRFLKKMELKSNKQDIQTYELEEEAEAEITTTTTIEDRVSWNIVPGTGEAQLFLNYHEGEHQGTVTELHSIPMQTEDGSIVQAIVLQSAEQVDAEAMHTEVYEMQDLAQVFRPMVEQQSSEPIVLTLESIDPDTQSAEQQSVVPDFIPQAASTPRPPSIKGRRIQPISPEQQIEVKLHRCKDCDKTFSTGMELLKHKKIIHRPENMFKCPFCENESTGALELILHIQVHNDDRPFHCEQCNFSTTDSFKLTRHKRTHTGEKPFTCNVCEAKFTQKTSMLMHIQRKHTKELPKLSCPLCKTILTGKHSLSIHLRKQHTHSETELKCRFCPATFRERFVLREHQKTHRNEKPIKSVLPRAKRRKIMEKSQSDQVNFEEQEPVIGAQAEEYTWQVLPAEQETQIHFVLSGPEEATSVTEYHLLPVQADDGSVISIEVSEIEEVEQMEAGTIHQVILGDI
ncbi:zinc finger protein 420-like isoform X2 [Rana temporaria]|uniref:zinc finger protein 420-like isoform X2 n=1 Tax=Rana temporaria TaxID=8407 RepID=UPI001AAC5661|nr:zinc finger protein 420-like isoform X2 [Rana temporaria]